MAEQGITAEDLRELIRKHEGFFESGSQGYRSLCRLTVSAAPSPACPDQMVSNDCPITAVAGFHVMAR